MRDNTPFTITFEVDAPNDTPPPQVVSFTLNVMHWAGSAHLLAEVITETIMEQAAPMPPKASNSDTTPVFDAPDGKPHHIPTTETER